jgi:hypothetical protein
MTLFALLQNRNSLDGLTDLYQAWCAERNYPAISADELRYELICRNDQADKSHIEWLDAFIAHWDVVLDREMVLQ